MKALVYLSALVMVLGSSCNPDPLRVNISRVDLDLRFHRFEQDLFGLDADSLSGQLEGIQAAYPVY